MKQDNFKKRLISIKNTRKIFIFLTIVFVFDFFLFPAPILAQSDDLTVITGAETEDKAGVIDGDRAINTSEIFNQLPENDYTVKYSKKIMMTAYNSDVSQCDSSPCVTANGFNVCEHGAEDTIAANFLDFGTKVRIPEFFGDRVFTVRDRMNARHSQRIDIWMLSRQSALNFGIQYANIEILEP